MSARWTAQGTPPGSQGRLAPGAPSTANPDVQNIVRLVKSDPDFRNELKNVIAEALQPDLERLRADLQAQMSSNNAAAASSNMPPPLDHEAIIQRDFPGATLEEWSHHDEQGSVYGFAETVSSHIIRHNNMAFLCDIKDVRSSPFNTRSLAFFGRGYPGNFTDAFLSRPEMFSLFTNNFATGI